MWPTLGVNRGKSVSYALMLSGNELLQDSFLPLAFKWIGAAYIFLFTDCWILTNKCPSTEKLTGRNSRKWWPWSDQNRQGAHFRDGRWLGLPKSFFRKWGPVGVLFWHRWQSKLTIWKIFSILKGLTWWSESFFPSLLHSAGIAMLWFLWHSFCHRYCHKELQKHWDSVWSILFRDLAYSAAFICVLISDWTSAWHVSHYISINTKYEIKKWLTKPTWGSAIASLSLIYCQVYVQCAICLGIDLDLKSYVYRPIIFLKSFPFFQGDVT